MEITAKTYARINAQFVGAATLKMYAMKTSATSAAKNTQESIAHRQSHSATPVRNNMISINVPSASFAKAKVTQMVNASWTQSLTLQQTSQ